MDNLTLLTIINKTSEELLGLYDEIIYMEDGYIVEKGSFKELVKKKGKFFELYIV